MSDPFRRGGFGSPVLTGPFSMGGGNFGQYLIGSDDGADIAYLDKLRAQTAWHNGQITDDGYLEALRRYVGSTEADSSSRVSAENELHDAVWSIGRNKIVRAINNAATSKQRISKLLQLARYDRRHLATMSPGNEAYREQQDRIASTMETVRASRWAKVSDQYQRGLISTEAMIKKARQFAKQTQGLKDHQTYREYLRQYNDVLLGEDLTEASEAWAEKPSAANAKAVDALYQKLVSRTKPGTPKHEQAVQSRKNWNEKVEAYEKELEDTRIESRHKTGQLTDEDYLDHLRKRLGETDKGTKERIGARDKFIFESAGIAQNTIAMGIDSGTHTVGDLLDFMEAQLFLMDPMSSAAQEYQGQINRLRNEGWTRYSLPLSQGGNVYSSPYAGAGGGGHMVYPGELAPGGTPVNKAGFASQFDGSDFASTNCGMASTAMLAWAVSDGTVKVSGGDMRYYSGDRKGGTNVGNGADALSAVGIKGRAFKGDLSYAEFRKRLKDGKPAVLSGISGMTAPELRIGGYTGAHGIYVDHIKQENGKTWYYVMDPLGRGNYRGKYWDEANLKAFGWGGEIKGFALFAGKGGHAQKPKHKKDKPPPKQAFDTDWKGESTVGKGGGTNREEAGPREDWSDGRPTRSGRNEKYEGVDEATVAKFLGAVGKVEQRVRDNDLAEGVPASEIIGDESVTQGRWNRAVELLTENGGDPRLAGIEWFTGMRYDGTQPLGQAAVWYANAVGRPLGLEKVRKGDTILAGSPDVPISAQDVNAAPTPAAPDLATAAVGLEPTPEGLDQNAEGVARALLERLGIPPAADAVRMMTAWVVAENGNKSVEGFNPLNLRTVSPNQEPGQIGQRQDGAAIFDTYEEGMDATADVLEAHASDVISAIRSLDPERFTEALGASGWSEDEAYANVVTTVWNTLPGSKRVISSTLPPPGGGVSGLTDASMGHPELVELLDVDPNDPRQKAWFDGNKKRAKAAAEGAFTHWDYESPDGTWHKVPVSEGITRDVLTLNRDYAIASGTDFETAQQELVNATSEITFADYQRYVDASWKERDQRLALGDWGGALDIEKSIAMHTNAFLGLPPDANPDITAHNNYWLAENQTARGYVERTIDKFEPASSNPLKGDIYNPDGSWLSAAVRDGVLHLQATPQLADAEGRPIVGSGGTIIVPDMNKAFVTYNDDGSVRLMTETSDPELFERVAAYTAGPDGETETTDVPAYVQAGWIPVQTNGGQVMVQPKPLDRPLFTLWEHDWSGVSESIQKVNPAYGAWAKGQQLGQMYGRGAEQQRPERPLDMLTLMGGAVHQLGNAVGLVDPWQMPQGPSGAPDEFINEAVIPDLDDATLRQTTIHDPDNGGHPPIEYATYWDTASGEQVTMYSFDGWQTHMKVIGSDDGVHPGLVIKNAKLKLQQDGTYVLVDKEGQPVEPEAMVEHLVWYGTEDGYHRPDDAESVGGAGQQLVPGTGTVDASGMTVLDGTISALDLYRQGAITESQAYAMSMQERKASEQWLEDGGLEAWNEAYEAGISLQENMATLESTPEWIMALTGVGKPTEPLDTGVDQALAVGMNARATANKVFLEEENARAAAQQQQIAKELAAATDLTAEQAPGTAEGTAIQLSQMTPKQSKAHVGQVQESQKAKQPKSTVADQGKSAVDKVLTPKPPKPPPSQLKSTVL